MDTPERLAVHTLSEHYGLSAEVEEALGKLIEKVREIAQEEEREACAKIALDAREDEEYGHAAFRCVQIAQAILARGLPQ